MSAESTGTGWFGGPPYRPASIRIGAGRTGRCLLALGVVAISVAGCGDGDSDGERARTDTVDVADAEAADTDEGLDGEAFIAACTLLSEDEAAEMLGGSIAGIDSEKEDLCRWRADDGWSITIDFFDRGTAPGNEFDPASVYGYSSEPVSSLEGAWSVGMGTVAFASHERVITVQVATAAGDAGGDRAAAEELARVVHRRIQETTG